MHTPRSRYLTLLATLLGTLIATLVAGLVLAPGASADAQRHRDPRGDVITYRDARVGATALDIVGSRNAYADGVLAMSVTMADGIRPGLALSWIVRRPGRDNFLNLNVNENGSIDTFFGRFDTDDTCPVDLTARGSRITVKVDRGCVGGVDSVRIATYSLAQADRPGRSRFDDANVRGAARRGIAFAPRLDHSRAR